MASDYIARTARDIANNRMYGPRAGAVSAADVIRRAVYHGSIALWMGERTTARQRILNARMDGDLSISPGERVRHPEFGVGTVISVEPLTGRFKIAIYFADVGRKTLAPVEEGANSVGHLAALGRLQGPAKLEHGDDTLVLVADGVPRDATLAEHPEDLAAPKKLHERLGAALGPRPSIRRQRRLGGVAEQRLDVVRSGEGLTAVEPDRPTVAGPDGPWLEGRRQEPSTEPAVDALAVPCSSPATTTTISRTTCSTRCGSPPPPCDRPSGRSLTKLADLFRYGRAVSSRVRPRESHGAGRRPRCHPCHQLAASRRAHPWSPASSPCQCSFQRCDPPAPTRPWTSIGTPPENVRIARNLLGDGTIVADDHDAIAEADERVTQV